MLFVTYSSEDRQALKKGVSLLDKSVVATNDLALKAAEELMVKDLIEKSDQNKLLAIYRQFFSVAGELTRDIEVMEQELKTLNERLKSYKALQSVMASALNLTEAQDRDNNRLNLARSKFTHLLEPPVVKEVKEQEEQQ